MKSLLLALIALTVAGCQGERDRHLAALRKLGGGVFTTGTGSDEHVVSVRFVNKPITDEDLKHVEGLSDLKGLEIPGTPITDAGLASVAGLTDLTLLDVSRTRITDAGLTHLQGLRKLEQLRLDRDAITDAGLQHLKGLTSLKRLGLEGTAVTSEGVRELRRAVPQLQVAPASLGGS
jgi:Leucine-rich repeat (LRR) protein